MSFQGFSWHSQLMMSSQREGSVDAQCDSDGDSQDVEIVIRCCLSGREVTRVIQAVDSSLSIGNLWTWAKKGLRERGEPVPRDEELKFAYGNEVLKAEMAFGRLFLLQSVQEGLCAAKRDGTQPILSFSLVRGSGGQMPGGGG